MRNEKSSINSTLLNIIVPMGLEFKRIEINLINYLKRPTGIKELEKAIKNYPSISQGILQNGKDISNPVGLLFYIAKNKVEPPISKKAASDLSKQTDFNNYEQHEYTEDELERLFEDIGW